MAKNIFRGTTEVSNIYRGTTEMSKVYRGQTEIWSAAVGTPDADAFITQVIADGGSLTATQESAIRQLETDLRATPGLYDKLHAIYPLVGDNVFNSRLNLKNASVSFTYTLSFQGSWSFTSLGVGQFAGSSAYYADTFLSPSGVAGLGTGIGLHVYLTINNQTASQYDLGANEMSVIAGFGNSTLYANFSSRAVGSAYRTVGGVVTGVGDLYSAQHDVNGVGNTSNWKNGSSLLSTGGSNFTTTESLSFYLGNDHRSIPPNEGGNKAWGFACISSYLNSSLMSAFNTAVQSYNSTLGR